MQLLLPCLVQYTEQSLCKSASGKLKVSAKPPGPTGKPVYQRSAMRKMPEKVAPSGKTGGSFV